MRTAANKIGSGKNTRRFAAVLGLLELRATHVDGTVMVAFPDGESLPVHSLAAEERLSGFIGEPLTFAREADVSHFDDGAVSIIGTASVAALAAERGAPVDAARFRANVLLDTTEPHMEEAWVGRHLRLGSAVVRIDLPSIRCVMINMKTADLPAQPGNLKAVARLNDSRLGVIASVVQPGAVRAGDRAVLM